jgi:hemerythrin-like metal-binding protein
LDEQHKKLIEMINTLYDAYLSEEQEDKISFIIEEMYEYARIHFKTEEDYFDEFGYTNTLEHKAEHASFLEKIKAFEGDYKKNSRLLSLQIMNFLQEWLTGHIMKEDKKYIDLFKAKGLK